MAQIVKHQQKSGDGSGGEYVEVSVLFHGRALIFRMKKNFTTKELWEAIKKKAEEEGIVIGDLSTLTISINQRIVVINEEAGTIEEVDEITGQRREIQDELINENVAVAITDQVEGGIPPAPWIF